MVTGFESTMLLLTFFSNVLKLYLKHCAQKLRNNNRVTVFFFIFDKKKKRAIGYRSKIERDPIIFYPK